MGFRSYFYPAIGADTQLRSSLACVADELAWLKCCCADTHLTKSQKILVIIHYRSRKPKDYVSTTLMQLREELRRMNAKLSGKKKRKVSWGASDNGSLAPDISAPLGMCSGTLA